MADVVRAPALPADLEDLVAGALTETYDLTRTAPLPDLQLGFRRLVEHLELLDRFGAVAAPTPPAPLWAAALWGDPANPPPTLRPQDVDVVGQDGGGAAVQLGPGGPGSSTPGDSDSATASKGCGIAVLAIILIDLLQAFVQCIGQWASGSTCTFWQNMLLSKLWEQDPPDPRDPSNPGVSQQQLTAIAGAPQATELVGVLFEAHTQAWEAMSRAREFLALTGLVYPTEREEADPVARFHEYPTSPIEHEDVPASPYLPESPPTVVFDPIGPLHAATVSLGQWVQVVRGQQDSQNLDLDADRGFGHPCWSARQSVHDDPVGVDVLGYDEQ
jgi:hypothetical protein